MDESTTRDTLTVRAEEARRSGDFALAIDLYRKAVDQNADSGPRARLAGLLEHSATQLVEQDLDAALSLYHEAWNTDRTREKLRIRFSRALRRRIGIALLEDDQPTALRLVEQGRTGDGGSTVKGPLLGPGIETLARSMPLEPLSVRLRPSAESKWLVLLDGRVDVEVLPALLRGVPAADIYSLSTPAGTKFGRLPGPVRPLDRAVPVGFETESRICEESDEVSRAVLGVLRRTLPQDRTDAAGIDILGHLSFAVDDVFFRTAKELLALRHLTGSGRYGLALVVTGEGMARSALRAVLAASEAAPPAWELRCSELIDAYDAVPRLLPAEDESTPIARSTRAEHLGHDAAAPRPSRVDRLLRRARWRRRRVSCAILATPNVLHVSNVAGVAQRISSDVRVMAVPLSGGTKRAQAHTPYERLLEHRPNTEIDNSCAAEPGTAPDNDPVVAAAVESATRAAGANVSGIDVAQVARPVLGRMLSRRLPFLQDLARRLDVFLEEERPAVLLVSPDRAPEIRIACSLARRRGIVTVFPQMAFFSRSPRYKPVQADKICVLDAYHRDLFVEYFRTPPHRVEVTGIPRFDSIIERRRESLPDPPDDGSVLLVLQSMAPAYNEHLTALLVEAVKGTGGKLRVQLHPRDTESSFSAISRLVSEELSDRGSVHWKVDVHELVLDSDVVVSTFSNVILEAAMLDRPVICANLTDEPLPVPFVEQGLATGADSADALREIVTRATRDASFRGSIRDRSLEYFAANPHLLSGLAADRVAGLVASLALNR